MFIEEALYRQIVACMPIACVDVIVRWQGQVMLVRRRNEPMRDAWWVPGGRIHFGEDLRAAARREAREDLGVEIVDLRLVGVYADVFDQSPFGPAQYHSISVVFEASATSDSVTMGPECAAWTLADEAPRRLRQKLIPIG